MKGVLVAVGIAAVAIGGAMYLRDGRDTTPSMAPNISVRATASGGFAPETVLQIRPQAASAPKPAEVSKRSALATEMSVAKSYKAIYDRLKSTPEGQTAEGMYFLAQILSACANVTDRKGPPRPQSAATPEEMRAKFVASISDKDPNRQARIAAYDNSATQGSRCAELRSIETTEKDIRDLRDRAAAAGDPKAQAMLVANEVMKPGMPRNSDSLPMISDAQLEALKQAARSGDPAAIQIAGGVLASTLGDLQIRAGPNEQPIDPRAFYNAWMLAACDAGANCGPDRVTQACAHQGQCGVDNLRDYYFFYENSPAQAQLLAEYSQHVRNAIATGDWSYFQFVRGVPPGRNSIFMFGSGY